MFMDFITDETENVFPMVPGGGASPEMIPRRSSKMRHILLHPDRERTGRTVTRGGSVLGAWLQHRLALGVADRDTTMSRMTIVTHGSDDVIEADHQAVEQADRG